MNDRDFDWPTSTRARLADILGRPFRKPEPAPQPGVDLGRLAEVLARPFRSDVGALTCLRCGLTAERSRPTPGFAGVPPACVCEAA